MDKTYSTIEGQINYELNAKYQGEYTLDATTKIRHGQGELSLLSTHKGGNKTTSLKGSFNNNLLEGYGTLTLPSGASYEGNFLNGLQHGEGRYVFPAGEIYEGQWACGKMHGRGSLRTQNDLIVRGIFEKGAFCAANQSCLEQQEMKNVRCALVVEGVKKFLEDTKKLNAPDKGQLKEDIKKLFFPLEHQSALQSVFAPEPLKADQKNQADLIELFKSLDVAVHANISAVSATGSRRVFPENAIKSTDHADFDFAEVTFNEAKKVKGLGLARFKGQTYILLIAY